MRIEQLTFTRFVAAFAIVIFHFGRDTLPFNFSIFQKTIHALDIGVSYFFILSGFVIAIAYSRQNKIQINKFYQLRIVRIFPAFLLSFVLTLLYLFYIGESIDKWNIVTQAFLVHAWIKKYCLSINFPSWSLVVELFFYFSFPLLYNFLYQKISLKNTSIFVGIIWVLTQLVFIYIQLSSNYDKDFKTWSLYYPLLHLNQFVSGNLLAYFLLQIQPQKRNTFLFYPFVVLVLLMLINSPIPNFYYHNGFLVPLFCLFIYFMAIDNSNITKIFQWPLFVLLGEISYGIYIYQFPIYRICNFTVFKILKLDLGSWLFYINFMVLLLVSYLSFTFIEKPLVDKIKARHKRN